MNTTEKAAAFIKSTYLATEDSTDSKQESFELGWICAMRAGSSNCLKTSAKSLGWRSRKCRGTEQGMGDDTAQMLEDLVPEWSEEKVTRVAQEIARYGEDQLSSFYDTVLVDAHVMGKNSEAHKILLAVIDEQGRRKLKKEGRLN